MGIQSGANRLEQKYDISEFVKQTKPGHATVTLFLGGVEREIKVNVLPMSFSTKLLNFLKGNPVQLLCTSQTDPKTGIYLSKKSLEEILDSKDVKDLTINLDAKTRAEFEAKPAQLFNYVLLSGQIMKNPELLQEKQYESWTNNKSLMYALVAKDPKNLKYASQDLKNDVSVLKTAMDAGTSALEFAGDEIKANKQFLMKYNLTSSQVKLVHDDLKNDPEFMRDMVGFDGTSLEHASPEIKNNLSVVLRAVNQNGTSLKFASPELKDNKRIVDAALKNWSKALQFAGHTLAREIISQNPSAAENASKEYLLHAMKENIMILKFADPSLLDNPEFMKEAIRQDPKAIQFIGPALNNNKDFLVSVLSENYQAFSYLNLYCLLKEDTEVVHAAFMAGKEDADFVTAHLESLAASTSPLKGDKEFITRVLNKNPEFAQHIDDSLQMNRDFMFDVIKNNPETLKFANESCKHNRALLFDLCKHVPMALAHASEELKNDPDLVFLAAGQNVYSLHFAGDSLKNSHEFGLKLVAVDGEALQFLSHSLKENKEIVAQAVRQNGLAIEHAFGEMRDDKDIALIAVRNNGMSLAKVSDRLKNDKQVVLSAIVEDPGAIRFASDELKNNKNFMAGARTLNPAISDYLV